MRPSVSSFIPIDLGAAGSVRTPLALSPKAPDGQSFASLLAILAASDAGGTASVDLESSPVDVGPEPLAAPLALLSSFFAGSDLPPGAESGTNLPQDVPADDAERAGDVEAGALAPAEPAALAVLPSATAVPLPTTGNPSHPAEPELAPSDGLITGPRIPVAPRLPEPASSRPSGEIEIALYKKPDRSEDGGKDGRDHIADRHPRSAATVDRVPRRGNREAEVVSRHTAAAGSFVSAGEGGAVTRPSLMASPVVAPLPSTMSIVGGPADVALQPHSWREVSGDLAALVTRLSAAREAMSPASAGLALAHAEFGDLALRFEQQADGRLAVGLSASDAETHRALAAALAAERPGPPGGEKPDEDGQPAQQGEPGRTNGDGRGASGQKPSQQQPSQHGPASHEPAQRGVARHGAPPATDDDTTSGIFA